MSDKNKKEMDKVLDHDFDGIQEYDNDLPRWWLALFWLGIAFGGVYYAYFYLGSGMFASERLAMEMENIQQIQKKSEIKVARSISEESLLAFAKVPQNITNGNTLYQGKCMPCHSADGGGLIGPNLTDDYWIHGGSLMDIRKVILDGVSDKGMIAWKALLTPTEVKELVAFIHSIRGSNAANPKEKQGELFEYNS